MIATFLLPKMITNFGIDFWQKAAILMGKSPKADP